MSMVQRGVLDGFTPAARKAFFILTLSAVCLLFAFPIIWLLLTSVRSPGRSSGR